MRRLRKEECQLIIALLEKVPDIDDIPEDLPNWMVEEMNDGGMGGLRFVNSKNKKEKFGKEVAEMTLLDVDQVPVSFALNFDTNNNIFELDIFKADFSTLKQFPLPPFKPI